MRVEILRLLISAHANGDEAGFRKAALQLAASESEAGHIRIAEEIRKAVAKLPVQSDARRTTIDIGAPRGQIADLLEGGHREERLRDIVLTDELEAAIRRVLRENRQRVELERWGVNASRRLLFCGPPGCGKTLGAEVVAGELGLPLLTIRFDALFSRFLGATANHLKVIFDEMPRRPGVYLFDEFDAVGKLRADSQDVGEIKRVVTSFLQLVDRDTSRSVVIAATNHQGLLDPAVFRRFDEVLYFDPPGPDQRRQLLDLRLETFKLDPVALDAIAHETDGLAFSDLARACDDAIKTMILESREELHPKDLKAAVDNARKRLGARDHPLK